MSLGTDADQRNLEHAVQLLEFPTFTAQLAKRMGRPIERAMRALPAPVLNQIGRLTEIAMKTAFRAVLVSVDREQRFKKAKNFMHKGLVVGTGATGGFLGGLTMAVELPISTGIMMRSIADIARSEGEDLKGIESQLACLEVLGLDVSAGANRTANGVETGQYFFARRAMATEITKAVEFLMANIADETVPVIARLLNKIAERFGIQLTQKMAAEMIPVVGAVTGAGINYLFIDHFQRIARGHFIVRRLERKYGLERIQTEYDAIWGVITGQQATNEYVLDEVAGTLEK